MLTPTNKIKEIDNENYCEKCEKLLTFDSKNVLFNGKLFHPNCFVCFSCGERLEKSYYIEKNGNPCCEKDYSNIIDKKQNEIPK